MGDERLLLHLPLRFTIDAFNGRSFYDQYHALLSPNSVHSDLWQVTELPLQYFHFLYEAQLDLKLSTIDA